MRLSPACRSRECVHANGLQKDRRRSAELSIRTHVFLRLQEYEMQNNPAPADCLSYVRNAAQEHPLLNCYAAVFPRISHRESGIFSSKIKPKLMLTSSLIWRVQVTRPRIAYRRSGCRRMPTASPGTTFFRELNFPPVSESSKIIAGWRVFSSDDSVSNVEKRGKHPFPS